MVVEIPEEYIGLECVPKKSAFGLFIQKYEDFRHESKIQKQLQAGVNFVTMSKLVFLRDYVLNPSYSLRDFVSIKDASLRGFLYEALWDICFKCSVVDGFDIDSIEHLQGKIEDIRMLKHQIKEDYKSKIAAASNADLKVKFENELAVSLEGIFTSQWSKLKTIKTMHEYMKSTKVQSGNTAGISDITFRYRPYAVSSDRSATCRPPPPNWSQHYVFVSSKYYINEKSISSYDIESIEQAVRGLNIKFRVVLVVKNKESLARKIRASHKKHVISSIDRILDLNDLHNAIVRLRRRCMVYDLDRILRMPNKILDFSYASHLMFMATKPFYERHSKVAWQCNTLDAVEAVTLVIHSFSQLKHVLITCSLRTEKMLRGVFSSSQGFPLSSISFNQAHEIVDMHIMFDMNHEANVDAIFTIVVDNTYSGKLPTVIEFGPKQYMQLKRGNDPDGFLSSTVAIARSLYTESELSKYGKDYPDVINLSDTDSSSKTFHKYHTLLDKSNNLGMMLHGLDVARLLINYIFGCPSEIHEDYVLKNRIYAGDKPMSVCIFIPDHEAIVSNLKQAVQNNKVTSHAVVVGTNTRVVVSEEQRALQQGKHFVFLTAQYDTLPLCANVIILTAMKQRTISCVMSKMHQKHGKTLYVVDLTPTRITEKIF